MLANTFISVLFLFQQSYEHTLLALHLNRFILETLMFGTLLINITWTKRFAIDNVVKKISKIGSLENKQNE